MSEDIKPVIWMDASGNATFDMQSSSGNVPITFYSDANSETITRDTFVMEEEVATDNKTIVKKNDKDKTYKIVALFSPKGQPAKQQNNAQPHYILTPTAKVNQGVTKFQVIAPSKFIEQPSPWLHNNNNNTRKRSIDHMEQYVPESRRRKTNHSGKGLRHFSMKVCEKVRNKQITTYNEVADELVSELYDTNDSQSQIDHSFDQKNIRRRVYDALNVLMAMNIISKEKKEIKWIGLPSSTNHEFQALEEEAAELTKRLLTKRQQLIELILQQVAFKNLLERNQQMQLTNPTACQSAIQLPFILVSTNKHTIIDCNISNDKYEFVFNFDRVFSIHDDIEILKSMGMCPNLKQNCTESEITKVLKHLPVALHSFIREMAKHPQLNIKTEPEANSYPGAYSSAADESLEDTGWGMADLSRHSSSLASRSDQPSPNYTNDSVDSE